MTDQMTDERALQLLRNAVEDSRYEYDKTVRGYAIAHIASRLQAQQPGAQAVVIPEPSDEDVDAAWVAFQANIPGNTMRALLSNDRDRLRERLK